jgi:hypothetical protein
LLLLLVGCCIGWSNGSRLRSRPGHSLSFFRRPIHRPKWQGKIPPMRSASLASHHHRPPPPIAVNLWLVVVCSRNLADCWCRCVCRIFF